PRKGLRRGGDADVDDASSAKPLPNELSVDQPFSAPELELAQVDRATAQAHSLARDLSGPARADEDAAATHADHEAVDARRTAAQAEPDVHQVSHNGTVGRHQGQPRQARDINDAVVHVYKRKRAPDGRVLAA